MSKVALTFGEIDSASAQKIVQIINGEIESSVNGLSYDDGEFRVSGEFIMLVRGWGYLTGKRGCNLDCNKAAEIQDAFADYIYNKLKKK